MRKVTSWEFRKCCSFWDLEVLNHSYRLPKSTQISNFVGTQNRCSKKKTRPQFWWEVNFWPPLKRQNFRDAYGMNCYPHLISCPNQDLNGCQEQIRFWNKRLSLSPTLSALFSPTGSPANWKKRKTTGNYFRQSLKFFPFEDFSSLSPFCRWRLIDFKNTSKTTRSIKVVVLPIWLINFSAFDNQYPLIEYLIDSITR